MIELFAQKTGIVIELKYVDDGNLEAGCQVALSQIEREGYTSQPELDGMKKIIKCAMACHVKDCKVVFEEAAGDR